MIIKQGNFSFLGYILQLILKENDINANNVYFYNLNNI